MPRSLPHGRTTARTRRLAAAALVLTAAALAAACSSSAGGAGTGGGSGSAAAGGALAAGIAKARAVVTAAEAAQPALTLPALPAKPASGKTVAVLGCPLPVCTRTSTGVAAAGDKLGWTTKTVTAQLTPEGYIAAMDQIVALKPDFVVLLAVFPNATIHSQLSALHDAGAKVIGMVSSDPVGPLMQANIAGPAGIVSDAQVSANLVVADAGRSVHTLYVTGATTKSTFAPAIAAYKSTLTGLCPTCRSTELDIDTSNIGRLVPGQIVSALQRDTAIRYVVSDSDDYLVGVHAALQSAGLAGSVKLIGRAPSRQSLAAVRDGEEFATVAIENGTAGYRAIDALARLSEGVSLSPCCLTPLGWHQIQTRTTVPADGALMPDGSVPVPGDPQAFLTAWHVG